MKSILLGAAFLGLMTLPAPADEISTSGSVFISGPALQIKSGIAIPTGTIEFLPATTVTLTGAFSGLEPAVTWQNMGQTIALTDIGTASDLACGLDCLFTIGAASFHVNSITRFGGIIVGLSIIEGIGTFITPEFEVTDKFDLTVANHRDPDLSQFKFVPEADVSFGFSHSVPAPMLGAGLPGVLALLDWFGWRRRRQA
jgi:hypothetical protein